MIHKLGLGTVQFGCDYGIANAKGQTSQAEAFKILKSADKLCVSMLDTSSDYGDSESVIGEFISKYPCSLDIVSKFSGSDIDIEEALKGSLKKLKLIKLYGYLIHNFKDFKKSPNLWDALGELKKKKLVKKIGFSLYLPEELEFLFKEKIAPDIIQIPYSVFDRRFEPYFETLQELGVEIHTRSTFLQGLVYLDPKTLICNFKKARQPLKKLQKIAEVNHIPVNSLCLNYVLLNPMVDKVIIGVDSLRHLKDNVGQLKFSARVAELKPKLDSLAIEDEDILLPYKWRKN